MLSLSWLVARVFSLYELLLLIRILMTWIRPNPYHPAVKFLYSITDPILDPARRLIPPMGMMDFSPVIVLLVLGWVRSFVVGILMSLGL